jgi:hypothetical protein
MADQILGRSARTLSIEENSFIIAYNQVNIDIKFIFSLLSVFLLFSEWQKNVIFGAKNCIFRQSFHDAF